MCIESRGLRHNALVYESQDEFLACAVPFLSEGLEADEGGIVAHTKPGLATMREALGPDAEHVMFVDVSSAYTRPVKTLASYHQVYAEQLQKTPRLRAVADVQFGPEPAEWDLWTGYEAVFNRSFGHLPAWVLCSYNANGTPDRILEAVWQTHPEVVDGETWTRSSRYEEPEDLFRRLTPQLTPIRGLRSIGIADNAENFRERLARELAAEQVTRAKALDMLVAATEIFTNAIEHGGGVEDIRIGRAGGRFACEVVDRGNGCEPTAGYLAPRPGIGTGLWIARQLTWRIELFRAPAGFTARIWL